MHRFTRQIVVRERYQLLALSDSPLDRPDAADEYAIATLDGALLRRDLTLESARRWLDQMIEDELARAPVGPVARRRR